MAVDILGRFDHDYQRLNMIKLPQFRELRKHRNILVLDTETADGIKIRTLAQIGYILESPSGEVLSSMDEYVYGAKKIVWKDSKLEMQKIKQGLPPEFVRDRLNKVLRTYNPIVVAHNVFFDVPILQKIGVYFLNHEIFCTCRDPFIKNILKLPYKGSKNRFKAPKQEELAKFCGQTWNDLTLHTAYDDVVLLTRILRHPIFF